MLLIEFYEYLEEVVILFDKIEYLEENNLTDQRMHELYKEFRRILLLEAVTDTIYSLKNFMEMFGSEIELFYEQQINSLIQMDSEN